MARRPLSSVEEETAFLAADEAHDRCVRRLRPHILGRFAGQGRLLDRRALVLGVAYSASSAARLAVTGSACLAWTDLQYPLESTARKAGRKGTTEAELIAAAVDAGLELGLQTLPASVRGKVDVEAARRDAIRRLRQGAFRRNLADLEEAQRAIGKLIGASKDPSLASLSDPERIASMFGITERQADSLANETRALVAAGKKPDAIRRAMARRVKQALEYRAETIAQQIGGEAISTAQDALFAQARKQGLLSEDTYVREWVTRRDARVCPRCDAFDGERADVGEVFESTEGEESDAPPLHPRCRCRVRLVRVANPKRGKRAA